MMHVKRMRTTFYDNKIVKLDSIKKGSTISADVYDYAKDYINYGKILKLLSHIVSGNAKQYWRILGEKWVLNTANELMKPHFKNMGLYQMATFSFLICKSFNDYNSRFEFHFFDDIIKSGYEKDVKITLLDAHFNNSLPTLMEKSDLDLFITKSLN